MKKILLIVCILFSLKAMAQGPPVPCTAQNINSAYADNFNNVQYLCTTAGWKPNIGIGAPTVGCSAKNYGQSYTDVAGNASYQCAEGGWFQGGGGGTPTGPAGGALSGTYPDPGLAAGVSGAIYTFSPILLIPGKTLLLNKLVVLD